LIGVNAAAPASNFDYAATLTETILLGTIAQRVGRRIEWDAKAMRITNVAEANCFVRCGCPALPPTCTKPGHVPANALRMFCPSGGDASTASAGRRV
jgi:hypothetical protein